MERLGTECEAAAKRFVAVDTGTLQNSITHRIEMYRGTPGAVVGSPIRYALYQEFGTIKMKGQPYLRPALMALSGESLLTGALEASLRAINVPVPE